MFGWASDAWDAAKEPLKKAAPIAAGVGVGVATGNPMLGLAAYQGTKMVEGDLGASPDGSGGGSGTGGPLPAIYGAAAGQLNNLAAGAGQEARDRSSFMMNGATNAQAQYNGANNVIGNYYTPGGGGLGQAGVGENAQQQVGWQTPGNSMSYYGSTVGKLSDPSAIAQYNQQMQQTLGQQGVGERTQAQNAAAYGRQGTGENYFQQNQGAYGAPGAQENLYADKGSAYDQPNALAQAYGGIVHGLSGPTNSQTAYDKNQGVYGNQSRSETMAPGIVSQFDRGQTIGSQEGALNKQMDASTSGFGKFMQANAGTLQGKTYTEQNVPTLEKDFQATNDRNQMAKNNYGAPGGLEQFAANSLSGNDPYYKQLDTEGRASLDQEMNARGGYNSGAAIAGLGKFEGNLQAAKYHDEGQLQGQAQNAAMQRFAGQSGEAQAATNEQLASAAARQGLFGQAQGEKIGQYGMGLQGQQAYTSALQRSTDQKLAMLTGAGQQANAAAQGALQAYGQGDQAALARTNAGMAAGGQADAGALARLNSMASTAGTLGSQNLDQLNSQFTQAGSAQNAALNRTNAGMTAANSSQADMLARMQAGQGAAAGAQNDAMARYTLGGNLAQGASSQDLAQMNAGMNWSQGLDASQLASGNAYQQDAMNAQNAAGQRYGAMLGAGMGMGNAMSNLTMQGYTGADADYNNYMNADYGMRANAIALPAQGALAQYGINANQKNAETTGQYGLLGSLAGPTMSYFNQRGGSGGGTTYGANGAPILD